MPLLLGALGVSDTQESGAEGYRVGCWVGGLDWVGHVCVLGSVCEPTANHHKP